MGAVDIIKNTVIWIIFLFVATFPLFILLIYKCIITIIAKLTVSNLSSFHVSDATVSSDLFYTDPYQNIGTLCKIDGRLDVNQVRQLFQTKLLDPKKLNGQPRNRNLYVYVHRFGGYNFKRAVSVDQLNIEEHIIEESLGQKPGQSEIEALSEFIKKFYYSPNTYGKPLWKAAVVNVNEQQSFLFFCIHHAIADGYSILYLFDELTGTKSPNLTAPFGETMWDKMKLIAGAPTMMMKFVSASMGVASKPLAVTGVEIKHHYALLSLDLPKVKTIRKQTNTHVYSILLAIVGSVFRRLLVQTGKYQSVDDLPPYMYMGTSLAWPAHPRNKMCNEWTAGFIQVPIKTPNRMERLLETEKDHNHYLSLGVHKLMRRLMFPVSSLLPAFVGEGFFSGDLLLSTIWNAMVAANDCKMLGAHTYVYWTSAPQTDEIMDNCDEFNRIVNEMLTKELDRLFEDCIANEDKGGTDS